MRFLAWVLGILLALGAGAPKPKETDGELRAKVQEHIDAIVDEAAGIVDDVAESVRGDERLQEAGKFVQDVIDVTEETAEELQGVLDGARARAEEKFGTGAPAQG